ncbi:MAG: 5-(carboxyamino)imidazole ribonucleotide mutase [Oligoflexales bacterium]
MSLNNKPLLGIVMGSQSDWPTMKYTAEILAELEVPFEKRVVSAHRTPDLLSTYAKEAAGRGLKLIIAGAGGAAHLPGMLAAHTWLPVLGVPVKSNALNGIDSLLSIVQMPRGIPVASLAIGTSGASNAALLAISILGLSNESYANRLINWRQNQSQKVLDNPIPGEGN